MLGIRVTVIISKLIAFSLEMTVLNPTIKTKGCYFMKKLNRYLIGIFLTFISFSAFAAEGDPSAFSAMLAGISSGVDAFFNDYFGWFVSLIFFSVPVGEAKFPIIVGWLFIAAIIFTFYFGFVQFRRSGLALGIVGGKYSDPNSKEEGEVSHFQALTTALSGTVGLGNIAGVGVAVAIGGPGATFWMIMCGLLGMASNSSSVL